MTAAATDPGFRAAYPHATRLTLTLGGAGLLSVVVVGILGLLQILYRAEVDVLPSDSAYYNVLTAHGTLGGYAFPFFFGSAVSLFFLARGLEEDVPRPAVAWTGFGLMVAGAFAWLAAIVWRDSAVLWTFYVPLQAHWGFYLGLALFVVGTWVLTVGGLAWSFRSRKRTRFPVMVYGTVANLLLWLLSSGGVAVAVVIFILPWSLGLTSTPNPEFMRTLFWFTGHPIVYVWLLPAYTAWYAVMPTLAGGRLFSDSLARAVFVMLLLFSLPVALHHQFMDPAITQGVKAFHAMNTFAVVVPSLLTMFTITASLEYGARRSGGVGLFKWIGKLPWKRPAFACMIVAFMGIGGAGASGMINASFNLNASVHNTIWVTAHLHVALATTVLLTLMGLTYWALPQLTGRALALPRLALAQPYTWFAGILLFVTPLYEAGILRGLPRRIARASYVNLEADPGWLLAQRVASVGGTVLLVSILMFFTVAVANVAARKPRPAAEPAPLNPALHAEGPAVLDRWSVWIGLSVLLVLLGWTLPILRLLQGHGAHL